jgi:hypothetical protein
MEEKLNVKSFFKKPAIQKVDLPAQIKNKAPH